MLATKKIRNLEKIYEEIGNISYVVPEVVKTELYQLRMIPEKRYDIDKTLEFIKNFKTIPISGKYADQKILEFVQKNKSIIATLDKELKKQIKSCGGFVMSLSNNKIILEN